MPQEIDVQPIEVEIVVRRDLMLDVETTSPAEYRFEVEVVAEAL